MIARNLIILLFFFFQHCDYKPIYSNLDNQDIKLDIVEIKGDVEMNNFVLSNIKKYSKTSSNKIFRVEIETEYKKENLIKNKKGEVTNYLIKNLIIFKIQTNNKDKIFNFSEEIKTSNKNNQFELKKYESSIKSNFVNSRIQELILKLSDL